jgi:hypothetical protein
MVYSYPSCEYVDFLLQLSCFLFQLSWFLLQLSEIAFLFPVLHRCLAALVVHAAAALGHAR